jgi:[acyl-carrier-protein] S-malonyltransferase
MTNDFAFLFPGQGSQAVGMGQDVLAASAAAQEVLQRANHALQFDLAELIARGPEETLKETINAQPAIVAVSLALLAALQERAGAATRAWVEPLRPAFVAGHSVGEYTAAIAAGALDLEAGLQLVRERGRLMHHEGQVCPGGMAAILGLDEMTVAAACAEATAQTRDQLPPAALAHPGAGRVTVANLNAPGQIVISGEQQALAAAAATARARGARRVMPLAVSGAFHSPVMAPAAAPLAEAIDHAGLRDAQIPVIANRTATPLVAAADLREELALQITAPVQWTRTITYLTDQGISVFVEIGPGQVLAGMVKRIAPGATTLNAGSLAEVAAVAARLEECLGAIPQQFLPPPTAQKENLNSKRTVQNTRHRVHP